MSLELAIQFMGEKGYEAKTVQVKASELPKDASIRAKIARNRQRADEYNYSRQQVGRNDHSRGAR